MRFDMTDETRRNKIPVLIDDDLIERYAREYHAAGGWPAAMMTFGLYVDGRTAGIFAAPLPPLTPLGEAVYVK